MTVHDVETLSGFVSRMGMYIQPVDQHTVISWIHGYQMGTGGRYKLTDLLSEELSQTYNTGPVSGLGWWAQLERFAERRNVSWIEAFRLVSAPIIDRFRNHASDGS